MAAPIFILCASDRYNYGDLLFPLVAQNELSKLSDHTFFNVGIVASDLSSVGAIPSHSYKFLYNATREPGKKILLIAGGEVLGANWTRLYSFLYPNLSGIFKFLSNMERATGKVFPVFKNPLPFVPLDERITDHFSLVFHAVGGKKAGPKHLRKRIEKTFNQSLYLSVREKATRESISRTFPGSDVRLTPDSAILMSELYHVEQPVRENYISFQIGHYKNGGNLGLINSELLKLHKKTNYPVKFIPIGNCPGHDDILSLNWLRDHARYPCEVVEPESIEKIMNCIARSSLFLGTSLHGIITAMSFAVPYLALNPQITKLKDYVFTWAPEPCQIISPFEELYLNALKVLEADQELLVQNANFQKTQARESFREIAQRIDQSD
jgi:hypothetical protein